MAKKNESRTYEEKLEKTLVPDWEQPYKVPSNWIWTRLGETFEWGSGGTPSRKIPEYYTGTIPWIKTGELCDGYIYDTEEKITDEAIRKSSAKIFPINTVVIAMYGATIGKVAILGMEATTNQACACAKPNRNVNVKYLFYYAISQKDNFIKKGKGGAQPNISQEIIKLHYFPLPPFDEQQRIIERIESLFSKLDEAKEKVQIALNSFENRKAVILHKAFTGKLTKKWRDENAVNIESWESGVLSDFLLKMTTKKPEGEIFRYIDIDAIDNKNQKVSEPKVLLASDAPSRASREVKENDTLFSMVRPYLRNIAFIDHELSDCIASTGFYVCRPQKSLHPRYLYYFLCSKDAIDYLMQFMKGDNSPSIRGSNLENMPFEMPSISEQTEVVRILDSIFEKEKEAKKLADVIIKIDHMKKAILARAFRGELGTNKPEEESAIELLKKMLSGN